MVEYTGKRLEDFKRDESGAFSLVMVGMFTSIILIGGTAIDLLRYEQVRSSLQYSLDRAVLAAASMRQTQDPASVVNDYMSKVEALGSFNVTMNDANTNVSLTSRSVSAEVTASYSTYFLRIAGMNAIDVSATSSASEEIPNMEISLVLDVSGSMEGAKLTSLKSAANTFVDTIIDVDSDALTSISLVPYASNVSLPQNMWNLYNVTELQNNSRCVIFDNGSYSTPGVSTSDPLRQLMDFDEKDSYTWKHHEQCKTSTNAVDYYTGQTLTLSEISPLMTDPTAIKAKINAMDAIGSTAGHIGTKWGLALLDPAAQGVGTMVGGSVADRPAAYDEAGVLKVMVVMTDGENRNHITLKNQYRTGPSDVWAVTTNTCYDSYYYQYTCSTYDSYYIQSESNGAHYRLGRGYSYWNLPGNYYASEGQVGYRRQLDWEEVWGSLTVYDPYYNSYDKLDVEDYAYESYQYESTFKQSYTTASQADTQMLEACSAAKQSNNVVVYSIAFEAPSSAQTLLQSCATSPGHYYSADTANIADVFSAIAVSVQKLKLTQ
jgi:Flp pilus assembly protein TadG